MNETTATPQPARALPGQCAMNALMRGVLATPGLAKLAGTRLAVLYVIGRKSGKRYAIPVAYLNDGGELLVGTSARWARNLRTGDSMTVRYKGRRVPMRVTVHTDEAGVTADYALIVRGNPAFATFNRVAVDSDGVPDAGDLHAAWLAGARGIRLTPLTR